MYIVYVLKSSVANKSYVGFTDNLQRRLAEHNSGLSSFTKKYKPWNLIYRENFKNYDDAVKREKYLKSASGRKLVLKQLF